MMKGFNTLNSYIFFLPKDVPRHFHAIARLKKKAGVFIIRLCIGKKTDSGTK